jgi:hypothetical protein
LYGNRVQGSHAGSNVVTGSSVGSGCAVGSVVGAIVGAAVGLAAGLGASEASAISVATVDADGAPGLAHPATTIASVQAISLRLTARPI